MTDAQVAQMMSQLQARQSGQPIAQAAAVKPVARKKLKYKSQAEAIAKLFPEGLVNAKGQPIKTDALKDKVIGLYFSAQWCGPCRAFTPHLVKYRNQYKDSFEVVFVSGDRNAQEMKKYASKMPWPAVKFRSRSAQNLSKKFGVRGYPTLILINADGTVLAENGRDYLMRGRPDLNKVRANALQKAQPPKSKAKAKPKA